MADPVIAIQGLSKRYMIGAPPRRHTLYDRLAGVAQGFGGVEFWALRDIDLMVCRGEVVGVIGHNGSGKSTLMKILARITAPDSGRIELEGRVGALLEIGMGFHPDLTGRENIAFSGAILGMSKREIARAEPAIIAFAEIDQFIDTPVKKYSTGMFMRLAFSVSAHLDSEILLVDEVLAVGDMAFQAKCIERMRAAARENRTVLFVSHGMDSVRQLCSRAIVLDHGRITYDGSTEGAVERYLAQRHEPVAG